MATYKSLLAPIRIGSMVVKNRFVVSLMVTNYCGTDGGVHNDDLIPGLEKLAIAPERSSMLFGRDS